MAKPDSNWKRKARWKEFGETVLEILKWLAVVWCLLPLARFSGGRGQVTRIVLGILLFILFSGKLLYDTLITDYLRQRRTSLKQDAMALAGMVLAIVLIIVLVLLMLAAFIAAFAKQSGSIT